MRVVDDAFFVCVVQEEQKIGPYFWGEEADREEFRLLIFVVFVHHRSFFEKGAPHTKNSKNLRI